METSIFNAYVIEVDNKGRDSQGRPLRDFLSFKLDFVHELAGDTYTEKSTGGRPRNDATNKDPRLDRMDHWSVGGVGENHGCVVCTARHAHYNKTHPGVSYKDNPFKEKKKNYDEV